jgi:TM2 domain-containing membrane protein YozV
MPTLFFCPGCRKQVNVPEQLLGQLVKCPTCNTQFIARQEPEPAEARPANEPSPGRRSQSDEKFCHECGAPIRARAIVCPKCGVQQPGGEFYAAGVEPPVPSTNRVAAGVFGILLGAFGIHKFILGMPIAGLIMLLVTVLTCGFGGILMHLIGLIEGILYLSKSDWEFYQTYVIEKRSWF